MNLKSPRPRDGAPQPLRVLPFAGTDAALVAALQGGHPGAGTLLYQRHREKLRRVLARVLGADQDLPDILQEVFASALSDIDQLRDGERLSAWLTTIAVFTARGHIRRRRRQRLLTFWAPETLPEPPPQWPNDDARAELAAAYRVLDNLPTEERIVFALRFLEGMELAEVADATGHSLATVKRRSAKAQVRFESLARRESALEKWLTPHSAHGSTP